MDIQVPNALFNIHGTDEYKRKKPPLTFDERLKGVNPYFGNVAYKLGLDDAKENYKNGALTSSAKAKLKAKISEMEMMLDNIDGVIENNADVSVAFKAKLEARLAAKRAELVKGRAGSSDDRQKNAVKRHALIRFLNVKYAGRALQVGMAFNPYILCGFPAIVFAAKDPSDTVLMKDMIGSVQQIQHDIMISSGGADARTSVVIVGARFVEDATDMDAEGNPIYALRTSRKSAEIDPNTFEYKNPNHTVNDGLSAVKRELKSTKYDLSYDVNMRAGYKYAKDLLSLSASARASGESNSKYVDEIYTPNKVAKFYKDVFGLNNSLMVGVDGDKKWMFDSIHEAVENFRASQSEMLYSDYAACIKRVYRRVCSAEEFYGSVMGASVKVVNGDKTEYIVRNTRESVDNTSIEKEYYGVSTSEWESGGVDELKVDKGGLLRSPGKFSSILESSPVTAFTQERRDAVELYRNSISNSRNFTQNG
jgi:hypothetical protein